MTNGGKIIIPAGRNIWPHELETAKALASYGHTVKFRKEDDGYKVSSADISMDDKIWELKSPKGSKHATIEKNLRRAKRQSKYIVFDSQRIKRIPDAAIEREILAKAPYIKDINEIIFVNRKRKCIDIYKKLK